MLRFRVFKNGEPASAWPLAGAHLIGSDGVPVRGRIEFDDAYGEISCSHREDSSVALALLHEAGELGELVLRTTLLPEREAPYLLSVELARHRVMLCLNKIEEWGLFDLDEEHPAMRRVARARSLLLDAIAVANEAPAEADRLGRACLEVAIDGSEELALLQSEHTLRRRRALDLLPRYPLGAGVAIDPAGPEDHPAAALLNVPDFVSLQAPWASLVAGEGEYRWDRFDAWTRWALDQRKPVLVGPLLSFEAEHLPQMVYMWEHDYEQLREVFYEHINTVVTHGRERVKSWTVVSGLHLNRQFSLSFDQIMDLTRLSVMQVKKLDPHCKALVEIVQPWGEYYASNLRSIPPITYADLINEASLDFDGFSLRLTPGVPLPGGMARDLMQVSDLLDRYGVFGRPVYLQLAVPAQTVTAMMVADESSEEPVDERCGYWRRPWSARVQSHWLEAVLQIAMGKPFVEGVTWTDLVDHPAMGVPLAGLLDEDAQPREAAERYADFARRLRTRLSPQEISEELEHLPAGAAANVAADDVEFT